MVLIFAVLTATFSLWLTYVAFKLNQNVIAKTLCENRFKPIMQCNGQCILVKKAAASEGKSKKQGINEKTSFQFASNLPQRSWPHVPNKSAKNVYLTSSSGFYQNSLLGSIFKPPRFS